MTPADSASNPGGMFYAVLDDPVYFMEGSDALDLLQRISTNDVKPVVSGISVATILTNEKGRIVDVVYVCSQSEKGRLILAGQRKSANDVQRWVERFIIMEDAKISIASGDWLQVRCWSQSPGSESWKYPDIRIPKSVAVVNESHWMNESVRLLMPKDMLGSFEELIASVGGKAVEELAYERSRILAGIPSVGRDISEETHPMEARLVDMISFTKGCYVGQEVVARLDTYRKVQRVLVRTSGKGRAPSTPAASVVGDGSDAGILTSAADCSDGTWRGVAFIRVQFLAPSAAPVQVDGETVTILDREPEHGVYPQQ